MRGNTREHQTNTRRKIGFARSRGESTKFGPGENYLHQTNTRRKIGFARSTSEVRAKVRSWSGRKVGTPDKHQTKSFAFTPDEKVLFWHQTTESFAFSPDKKVLFWHQTTESFAFSPDEKVLFWYQTKKFCFGTRRESFALAPDKSRLV